MHNPQPKSPVNERRTLADFGIKTLDLVEEDPAALSKLELKFDENAQVDVMTGNRKAASEKQKQKYNQYLKLAFEREIVAIRKSIEEEMEKEKHSNFSSLFSQGQSQKKINELRRLMEFAAFHNMGSVLRDTSMLLVGRNGDQFLVNAVFNDAAHSGENSLSLAQIAQAAGAADAEQALYNIYGDDELDISENDSAVEIIKKAIVYQDEKYRKKIEPLIDSLYEDEDFRPAMDVVASDLLQNPTRSAEHKAFRMFVSASSNVSVFNPNATPTSKGAYEDSANTLCVSGLREDFTFDKNLKESHIIKSNIIHELTHAAMFAVYKNEGRPYKQGESKKFDGVIKSLVINKPRSGHKALEEQEQVVTTRNGTYNVPDEALKEIREKERHEELVRADKAVEAQLEAMKTILTIPKIKAVYRAKMQVKANLFADVNASVRKKREDDGEVKHNEPALEKERSKTEESLSNAEADLLKTEKACGNIETMKKYIGDENNTEKLSKGDKEKLSVMGEVLKLKAQERERLRQSHAIERRKEGEQLGLHITQEAAVVGAHLKAMYGHVTVAPGLSYLEWRAPEYLEYWRGTMNRDCDSYVKSEKKLQPKQYETLQKDTRYEQQVLITIDRDELSAAIIREAKIEGYKEIIKPIDLTRRNNKKAGDAKEEERKDEEPQVQDAFSEKWHELVTINPGLAATSSKSIHKQFYGEAVSPATEVIEPGVARCCVDSIMSQLFDDPRSRIYAFPPEITASDLSFLLSEMFDGESSDLQNFLSEVFNKANSLFASGGDLKAIRALCSEEFNKNENKEQIAEQMESAFSATLRQKISKRQHEANKFKKLVYANMKDMIARDDNCFPKENRERLLQAVTRCVAENAQLFPNSEEDYKIMARTLAGNLLDTSRGALVKDSEKLEIYKDVIKRKTKVALQNIPVNSMTNDDLLHLCKVLPGLIEKVDTKLAELRQQQWDNFLDLIRRDPSQAQSFKGKYEDRYNNDDFLSASQEGMKRLNKKTASSAKKSLWLVEKVRRSSVTKHITHKDPAALLEKDNQLTRQISDLETEKSGLSNYTKKLMEENTLRVKQARLSPK